MAVIFGTQGRDTLPGTDQDDVIRGWAADGDPATDLGDRLSGLGGDDKLSGGGGDDLLVGGDGDDTLAGGDGDDRLGGFNGADQLLGGNGSDQLSGGGGADVLAGGAGPDQLEGGGGADLLFGGGGRDSFDFRRGYDMDTILDFKDDVDTLELGSSLGVTSRSEALSRAEVVDGDTVFAFDTGDVLVVENIADPNLLRDDIYIV